MSTVERLLAEYVAAFQSGQTDPWPYLDQVEGEERDQLDRKMDEFLTQVEPARWDEAAYRKSPASGLVDRLVPEMLVPEHGWCDLLPSLRLRMKMKREAVTAELARSLEAKGREEDEKVADYYNDMEQGNLDPRGVSDQVLEALSGIYGTTVDVLRRVGEATRPPDSRGAVFARGDYELMEMADARASLSEPSFSRIKGKPDRIDRLFVAVDRSEPDR
jgi:hypothetical protein